MPYKGYFLSLSILIVAAVPYEAPAAVLSANEHWRHPLALQGRPPVSYSEVEASLDPESCATCHIEQFEGWKGSRHAIAMGPGIEGQLHAPWIDAEGETSCLECHAPLAEQSRLLRAKGGSLVKNGAFLSELRERGISCAACHLRKNIRYGPKRRGEALEDPPHGGFKEADFFSDSKFCRPCHQFDAGDNGLSGKLLQNTYEEWKSSGYPEKGVHCQTCHMPDRAHLWRGIHDPEMVKKGIDISAERIGEAISLVITNSGTGHNFPSYVTPRVRLRAVVLDKNGSEIPGSSDEVSIGWSVALDLSEEYYDTRIAPGKSFSGSFDWKGVEGARAVIVTIDVYPDDFYRRFFEALISDPPKGVDLDKLGLAYKETKRSAYRIFEKELEL